MPNDTSNNADAGVVRPWPIDVKIGEDNGITFEPHGGDERDDDVARVGLELHHLAVLLDQAEVHPPCPFGASRTAEQVCKPEGIQFTVFSRNQKGAAEATPLEPRSRG